MQRFKLTGSPGSPTTFRRSATRVTQQLHVFDFDGALVLTPDEESGKRDYRLKTGAFL